MLTRRLRETRRNGPFGMIFDFRISLWARDSTGQWHVTYVRGSDDYGNGNGTLRLDLIPPLPGSATSIEVFVTGPSGRIRAAMPLEWS